MSKLLETLVDEHERILDVLGAFHDFARFHAHQAADGRQVVARFVAFFRGYVDEWHHHKEERVLFPAMGRAGFPMDHGPVGCMSHEHESGRDLVHAIAELGQGEGPLDVGALDALLRLTPEYVRFLANHIAKENQMLYPMAERRIPPADLAALDDAPGPEDAALGPRMEALADDLCVRFRAQPAPPSGDALRRASI